MNKSFQNLLEWNKDAQTQTRYRCTYLFTSHDCDVVTWGYFLKLLKRKLNVQYLPITMISAILVS